MDKGFVEVDDHALAVHVLMADGRQQVHLAARVGVGREGGGAAAVGRRQPSIAACSGRRVLGWRISSVLSPDAAEKRPQQPSPRLFALLHTRPCNHKVKLAFNRAKLIINLKLQLF